MEGGYHPWKNQKIVNLSPDYEYFSKSLPPPPNGHCWERQDNGEWILFRMPVQESTNSMEFTKPSIFEHTVMTTDTLQGLCLRYRVSATSLRRMNMFSGNNIHFKKTLLIPVEGGTYIEFQQCTEDVILQRFRNETQEAVAESRLYLDEHNWNLEAALAAWKKDEKWIEDSEKDGFIIPPVPVLDIPDDDDQTEETAVYADAIAPVAIATAIETIPAFISSVHPSQVPTLLSTDIELRTLQISNSVREPLLSGN